MAKKIALINMKGGVGKSTLTVNLAWFFADRKWSKRVLVVDLDPQFNASQYLLSTQTYRQILLGNRPTVWDIFERKTRTPQHSPAAFDVRTAVCNRVTLPAGGKVDIIPARLELAFTLKTPYQQKERELANALSEIENDYDLMLIDCPPMESLFTTAAYLCSDSLLVPIKPEFLSSIGLPLLVNSMKDFAQAYGTNRLEIAGIVFNGTTEYSPEEMLAKSDVRQIAQQHGWHVFQSEVTFSRSYPKGARLGLPIYRTPNARRSQCKRFSAFAQEFGQRIGL